jgi:putative ABC transport system permease protein
MNDLHYAFRNLAKTPAFTIAAVLTLALGIGANTAIFQLIDAVALRPLPIPNPEELVEIRIVGGNRGFGLNPAAYGQLTRPVWQELRDHQQALSGLFAWGPRDARVGERSELRAAKGIAVSGEFFASLGVQPYRGRLTRATDETTPCPATVAVVSYDFWQREMGGRELTPATRLRVNLDLVDVVGVTPPGFFGVAVGDSFDIAQPLCRPKELRRDVFDVAVMGRLRPGWTVDRASAHLNALSAGIFESMTPADYSADSIERFKAFRLAAYPAASGVSSLRTRYETSLRLLFAITVLILLIACANLANLMLARATVRDREVAVRVAIGASRMALVRQFLAESCLLGGAGAALAVLLAGVLGRVLLVALATGQGGPSLTLTIDWRVLLYATLAAFATCVVFGLAPAVRATRVQPVDAMKAGGRGTTSGHQRLTLQRLLVAAQIAMALVMLVSALLFVQSFRSLMTVDTGMRQEGISFGFLTFPESIGEERRDDFRRELLAEIDSVPGVVNAGTTTHVPLIGGSWSHGVRVGAVASDARFTWVSPGYFDTMGIRIVQGRDFTLRDVRTSPRVAVVNQRFVRQFVGNTDPIGQTLQTSPEPGYPSTVYEIVGVIPDTQYNDLRTETQPIVFAPDSQHPSPRGGAGIMIHSTVPPELAIARVRRRIAQRYPGMISEFSNFQSRIQDGLARERLLALLAGFFGALAIVLTVVGLYGMLSYAVAQRRPEIGVRIAIGALRHHVIGLVMREAGWLLVTGVIAGMIFSLVAGRTASTLLFGVKPNDPMTLVAACSLLTIIATAASFLPARRASRIDPAQMLREG